MAEAQAIAETTNRPDRRGACPTLAQPMQTGDGLLARFRPIGNALSLDALEAIARAAEAFGNGLIEITARGSLQVRGLSEETAPRFAEAVVKSVEIENGVPVETPPLAGLDPSEMRDPRPFAQRLRAAIATHGLAGRLSPKVTVIVDAGGRQDLSGLAADVRVTAREDGWIVAMGGEICPSLGDDAAIAVTLDFLERIAEAGPMARGRDFGETRAVAASSKLVLGASVAADGTKTHGLGLALGSVTAITLIEFMATARDTGATGVRLAPGRGLYVVGSTPHPNPLPGGARGLVSSEDGHSAHLAPSGRGRRVAPGEGFADSQLISSAQVLLEAATHLGFITNPSDPRLSMSACAGMERCASGSIATRALAAGIAEAAPELFDGSFDLHVSGCAKGCAHPRRALLTLVGEAGACGLVINGRAGDPSVLRLRPDRAITGFVELEALFHARRYAQESAFDCLTRLGPEAIAAAFTQGRR
jgi:precorrin-3B synthase